jgi:hypothetical protein
MTHLSIALALAALPLLVGCGKYGPPVRPSEAGRAGVSGVTAGHPPGCQDPDHHHDGAAEAGATGGAGAEPDADHADHGTTSDAAGEAAP